VQLGSPAQVFMVGGGEFNMQARSLQEIRKLEVKENLCTFTVCADMKH
jgi:hypothetical protein